MCSHFRTTVFLVVAFSAFPSAASKCLKSAEQQAVSLLKKAGHADTLRTRNTHRVYESDEARQVYKLSSKHELYSTEIWEDELSFAVYDVLVEGENCRLRMVRAGGI